MRKGFGTATLDDLTAMAVFVRVVEAHSFSGAARALGTTTSAVSKRVARLEERLGTRLLSRTTRRISLTEPGAALFERASSILADVEAAEVELGQHSREPRGTLRVNAPVLLGHMHLAALLPEFLGKYPEIRVDLTLDDRYVNVLEEGYDAVVRIGRLVDSGLMARKLGTAERVVCASPDYLAEHGTPRAPQELLQHNCLRYTYVSPQNEWRFRGPDGREFAVTVRGNLQVNHGGAMREAMRAGLGLGHLPRFIVQDELKDGSLRAVLEEWKLPEFPISVLYPPGRQSLPKVQAFVDFLVKKLPERLAK